MAIGRFRYGNSTQLKPAQTITKVYTLPILKAIYDCFEEYLSLNIAKGNPSSDTVRIYRNRVDLFLTWCKKQELNPALVTTKNIRQYRKHLIDTHRSTPTICLSLTSIRHLYTACVNENLVKNNPVTGVQAPPDKREVGSNIDYLSEKELQELFNAVAPSIKIRGDKIAQVQLWRDRLILGLMALQGCRSIEIHRANWGDLSYLKDYCCLEVDGKNSLRKMVLRTDITEEITLYRQALQRVKLQVVSTAPMFISLSNRSYGLRLSRPGLARLVSSYLKKCNLKQTDLERSLSPHSLRHTAGTLALRGGSDLREVQDFLGHSDPKTTAIYTHVLNSQEHNPAAKINVTFKFS